MTFKIKKWYKKERIGHFLNLVNDSYKSLYKVSDSFLNTKLVNASCPVTTVPECLCCRGCRGAYSVVLVLITAAAWALVFLEKAY